YTGKVQAPDAIGKPCTAPATSRSIIVLEFGSIGADAGIGWLKGLSAAYHRPLVEGGGAGVVVVVGGAGVVVVVGGAGVVVVVGGAVVVGVVVVVDVGVVVDVTVVVMHFFLQGLRSEKRSTSWMRSTAKPRDREPRTEMPS